MRNELLALDPDADFKFGNATLTALLQRLSVASAALYEQLSVQFFSYTGKAQQRKYTP